MYIAKENNRWSQHMQDQQSLFTELQQIDIACLKFITYYLQHKNFVMLFRKTVLVYVLNATNMVKFWLKHTLKYSYVNTSKEILVAFLTQTFPIF